MKLPIYHISDGFHARAISSHLLNEGSVLLKGFDVQQAPISEHKSSLLEMCSAVGDPVSHDAQGTLVWDIRSNPDVQTLKNGIVTYSEHNHEADLHTDSQYSEYPEDYFALLTLRQATCGGGWSYLLSLADLIQDLNNTTTGREMIDVLSTTDYPFIMPRVFKLNNDDKPEYNFGPILRDQEIRFRIDTIQKAIELNPHFCTEIQVSAFNYLKDVVTSSDHIEKFLLEDGDLIFINNKTMLHGRSQFTDHSRHLLRVRMNKQKS